MNGSNTCSGDVVWPVLDGVIILGASQPLPSSFTLQVGTATVDLHNSWQERRSHVPAIGQMGQGSCKKVSVCEE